MLLLNNDVYLGNTNKASVYMLYICRSRVVPKTTFFSSGRAPIS